MLAEDLANIQPHLVAALLGMPRLLMICHVAPFFGGSQLPGQVRFALVLSLYLILHPFIVDSLPEIDALSSPGCFILAGMMAKEVLLGFLLAMLAGMAFWTLMCVGFFIDNQRGAGMASGSDPLSGEQTSPTGAFFMQSAVYLFFSTGAYLSFFAAVYASYEFWPVGHFFPSEVLSRPDVGLFFAGKVARHALEMVLFAGPVVLACLFVDIGLGIVNRFASQLHVYVLAMPIKSGIASLLIIFYFSMLMKDTGGMFDVFNADLLWLRRYLP